jgi:predicted ATP-grasp superfamily ATP-dependent carboligase
MRCIFYYQNPVIGINRKTQAKKGFIIYYKTNGIIFHKKHVDIYHSFIAQMFEEVNNLLKSIKER